MRIKSPVLYRNLYFNKKLPFASRSQLQRYMEKMKPIFGFQGPLFEVLEQKTEDCPERNKHGKTRYQEFKSHWKKSTVIFN